MQNKESVSYYALLALTIALSLLALITLLPNPAASKPNVLGYRSVCSFAPAASALCGLLAGLTCTIRNRRFSRSAASARFKPLIVPIFVALVLLAVAAVFGVRFGVAQSRFGAIIAATEQAPGGGAFGAVPDGTKRGAFAEGEVSATVQVTVNAGSIDSLTLVEGKNVDQDLAAKIFQKVKAAGSLKVDAVSGATASSNVVLKAIAQALEL